MADKLDGAGVAPGPLPDWVPSIELPSQARSWHAAHDTMHSNMIALQSQFGWAQGFTSLQRGGVRC